MTLTEIAKRITAHLQRFEGDEETNPKDPVYGGRFYCPSARRSGSRIRITYRSFQSGLPFTREQAAAYLAWLDALDVPSRAARVRTGRGAQGALQVSLVRGHDHQEGGVEREWLTCVST